MQVSKSPIHISSRGARFVDLVKQNKLLVSPQLVNKRRKDRRFSMGDAHLKDRDNSNRKNASTPMEYLKFSTQIKYDPDASPSTSILSKRKADNGIPVTPLTSSMKVRKEFYKLMT